jgi:2-amino-4-hydroxy-6-hydroxymethyldihydropteridine diphosphokinase
MNNGIFLLLGTNLGDRSQHLATARALIEARAGKIIKTSAIYQTAAWGKTDQPDFYNQVIEIESILSPDELLKTTLGIEEEMGRVRTEVWGARTIDIDILLYSDIMVEREHLIIPHPRMNNRKFTLIPLAEIAPEVIHPVTQKTIRELLAICTDKLNVFTLTL